MEEFYPLLREFGFPTFVVCVMLYDRIKVVKELSDELRKLHIALESWLEWQRGKSQ